MTEINDVAERREVDVSITSSRQSLDLLKTAGNHEGEAALVLTSFQLRKSQKLMVEELARLSGESQATVVRAIIDEWREMKLRGCD